MMSRIHGGVKESWLYSIPISSPPPPLPHSIAHFIHIWYSNQVPYVANPCKISFGCMPNLSNYTNIFLKFYVYCAILEKNGLILFIFNTVINHNEYLMRVK